MFEKLIAYLTKSLAVAEGPIRIPAQLEAELDAWIADVQPVPLARWLELPRDDQGPPAALALYKSSAGALTVAIVDARTQALYEVLEGTAEDLPRFTEMFLARFGTDDHAGLLAGVKIPSDPPPPPPDFTQTDDPEQSQAGLVA